MSVFCSYINTALKKCVTSDVILVQDKLWLNALLCVCFGDAAIRLNLQSTCFTGIWSEMVSCVSGVGVIAMHLSRVRKVIRGEAIPQSSLTFESRLGS